MSFNSATQAYLTPHDLYLHIDFWIFNHCVSNSYMCSLSNYLVIISLGLKVPRSLFPRFTPKWKRDERPPFYKTNQAYILYCPGLIPNHFSCIALWRGIDYIGGPSSFPCLAARECNEIIEMYLNRKVKMLRFAEVIRLNTAVRKFIFKTCFTVVNFLTVAHFKGLCCWFRSKLDKANDKCL